MKKENNLLLNPNELSTFCAQIAMILKAGIPISEGIAIIYEDTKNAEGKKILETIKNSTELGEPFSDALKQSGNFPQYVVDMTRIGEQSGKLDEVMDSLCSYYEREENIVKNVKSAVTYPLIMVLMMLVVIGVLIMKVLPVFSQVYSQLGSSTLFVQNIINISSTVVTYVAIIILLCCIGVLIMFFMKKSKKGRIKLAKFNSWFFITKNISSKIACSRFASAMSLMMSSGLDIDMSLDMTDKLIDNINTSKKIKKCKELTANGTSFSEALFTSNIFTGICARMIAVGFKTGSVDTVMKKLAERYEEDVDNQIDKVISFLEPTLVAILSIVVGIILLSVMLPLMGIMSSIG